MSEETVQLDQIIPDFTAEEWRGVKVAGHIEEILEAARQLNK